MKQIIDKSYRTIQDVEKQFREQAEESTQIMDSLASILNNDVFTKNMPETFREIFRNIVIEGKQRFDKLYAGGVAVDKGFAKIVTQFRRDVDS